MEAFWFWFLILLLIIIIFAWPTWPYTRERWVYGRRGGWRYAPSGVAAILAIFILLLFWLGLLAIWWPWYTYPVAA